MQGLRGRLTVYGRRRGAVSGFGEAALDRALADPDWIAAQLEALRTSGAKRTKVLKDVQRHPAGLVTALLRRHTGPVPTLQIDSVEEPLVSDAVVSLAAAHLVARTQYVGALPSLSEGQNLGRALIASALAGLSKQGVARDAHLALASVVTSQDLLAVLRAANEQMEQSPMPASTWPVVLDVLGEELLGVLLDVSPVSIRRYKEGHRPTPGPVAHRLHFLALLLADLAGAYNEYGIRRWFGRTRQQLDGKTPLQLLAGGFDPEGAAAQRVKGLVNGLVSAGAT